MCDACVRHCVYFVGLWIGLSLVTTIEFVELMLQCVDSMLDGFRRSPATAMKHAMAAEALKASNDTLETVLADQPSNPIVRFPAWVTLVLGVVSKTFGSKDKNNLQVVSLPGKHGLSFINGNR